MCILINYVHFCVCIIFIVKRIDVSRTGICAIKEPKLLLLSKYQQFNGSLFLTKVASSMCHYQCLIVDVLPSELSEERGVGER